MSNIKTWLLHATEADGEEIEAIVVGQHYSRRYDEPVAAANENVLLSKDEGLALLDEEYDSGYGGADCRPMYAWTATKVYFISEYDGATGLNWAPRNPLAIEPNFDGES